MAFLDPDTTAEVRRRLSDLSAPVNLVHFRGDDAGQSGELSQLLGELRGASERVTLEEHDYALAGSLAYRYGLEGAPAIVVESDRDYGIRYYGAPSGHEFETLLEVMSDVSRGEAELAPELRARLGELRDPVHIRVFTTPT